MTKTISFYKKHKTHIDSFLTGFVADFIIDVTPYLTYFINISDEQIVDINFWGMVGSGVLFAIVRAFIKQVGQTALISLKNFIKNNK